MFIHVFSLSLYIYIYIYAHVNNIKHREDLLSLDELAAFEGKSWF